MGIKRARAVIREEFQPSGNKSGGGWLLVLHCKKKTAIKKAALGSISPNGKMKL